MNSQLQILLDTIKNEGVEKAKNESSTIIKEAKQKAKEVVQKAEKEAAELISNAKRESEQFRKSSEKSLEQSARNVIMGLHNEIENVFNVILKQKVGEVLSSSELKNIIAKFIENWQKHEKDKKPVEVLVSEKDKKQLEHTILHEFKSKAKAGIELKAVKGIKKGFMIGEKGSNVHYDITDAAIADTMKEFLNPKLREILKNSLKKN